MAARSLLKRDKGLVVTLEFRYEGALGILGYEPVAGFEDVDDCDRLCGDGILKMCAGRSASDEIDLASQPTMTRLENRLSRKELFDIGEAFIDDFIASYDSEPDSIIIIIDADTYGAQQLTLFNAYYGEYCYMVSVSDLTCQLHKESRARALLFFSPFVWKKVSVSLGFAS